MKNNDDNVLNEILDTKKPINNLYEDQIERRAKLIKQNYYENGPK